MGLVMNENEAAEQAIRERCLGNNPPETLRRVARYYIDECPGVTKKIVRSKLEAFLLWYDPMISLPKWSALIDHVIGRALKRKAIQIESIIVTKPEIKRIDALGSVQAQRLAFTLLCLSKYWNEVNSSNDSWVNCDDKEIMSLANIKTSMKRQCALYSSLRELGLIRFSKRVDNTNVKVLFAEDGETAMKITDIRNLGYQYLKYQGAPYFECANCGLVTKIRSPKTGRSQKYCSDCAVKIKIKQSVESTMRQRKSAKTESVYEQT